MRVTANVSAPLVAADPRERMIENKTLPSGWCFLPAD